MKCPRCNGSGKIKMPATVGGRLVNLREANGLLPKEVEHATGIGHSHLHRLEHDQSKATTFETLIILANFYKVTTDEILGHSADKQHD